MLRGIQDDRSSQSDANVYANGVKVGTFRKLRVGDVVSLVVNLEEGWCDLHVNLAEMTTRFTLGPGAKPGDYIVGVCPAPHTTSLMITL